MSTYPGDFTTTGSVSEQRVLQLIGQAQASQPAPPAGGLTLITSITVSTPVSSIDVPAIDQSYNDLIVVTVFRGATGGGQSKLLFNGDAGLNYYSERTRTLAAAVTGSEFIGIGGLGYVEIPSSGVTAGIFSVGRYTLFEYSNPNVKTVMHQTSVHLTGTVTNTIDLHHIAGFWNNAAAVTRITADCAGVNLVAGSQLRIYGRI